MYSAATEWEKYSQKVWKTLRGFVMKSKEMGQWVTVEEGQREDFVGLEKYSYL